MEKILRGWGCSRPAEWMADNLGMHTRRAVYALGGRMEALSSGVLEEGALQLIWIGKTGKKCLACSRITGHDTVYIYLNFSSGSINVLNPLQNPRLIFSTVGNNTLNRSGSSLVLEGYEGVIIGDGDGTE